jgi:hypothetical protein
MFPDPNMIAIVATIISIIGGIIIYAFFCSNLSGLINSIQPENRRLNPNVVWLLFLAVIRTVFALPLLLSHNLNGGITIFIEVFDYVLLAFMTIFQFYLVIKIADSLMHEYHSRNIPFENKPTFSLGIAMCATGLAMQLARLPYVKIIGGIAAIVYIVLFIMYWVKTHQIKQELRKFPDESLEQDSIFRDI